MAWRGAEEKIDACAAAVRGLWELEPDPERRRKYMGFVDMYSGLDDNERELLEQRYPQEGGQMVGYGQRRWEEGLQEGRLEGEAAVLSLARAQVRGRSLAGLPG